MHCATSAERGRANGARLSALLAALALIGTPGCAALGGLRPQVRAALELTAPEPSDAPTVHLDLVAELAEQGRCLAALAHLDAHRREHAERPPARLLRADCLRRTGQREAAAAIYRELLRTDERAEAHRGLGLLSANPQVTVVHLELARKLQPASARIRNDLGYALLLVGRLADARRELATALELSSEPARAASNLLLLLLVEGEEQEARALARRTGAAPEFVAELRLRAASLRAALLERANPVAQPPAVSAGAGRGSRAARGETR